MPFQDTPEGQTYYSDVAEKIGKLLEEIRKGKYGTKNRSELILKLTDIQGLMYK